MTVKEIRVRSPTNRLDGKHFRKILTNRMSKIILHICLTALIAIFRL